MSSCRKVGAIDGGVETMPLNWLTPKKIDSTVTDEDADQDRAAHLQRVERDDDEEAEDRQQRAGGCAGRRAPISVAGLSTTMPAFFSAMIARNRPMPAAIALRSECGMPAIDASSRTPVTVSRRNMHARDEHRAQRLLPGEAHARAPR